MRSEQAQAQTQAQEVTRVTVTSPSTATLTCAGRAGTWAQGCLKDSLRRTGYQAGPADIEAQTPVTTLSHFYFTFLDLFGLTVLAERPPNSYLPLPGLLTQPNTRTMSTLAPVGPSITHS